VSRQRAPLISERDVELTELNEEFPISLSLIGWEREDAGDIVVFCRHFVFTKIPNDVKPAGIRVCHDVEQERIRVVVTNIQSRKNQLQFKWESNSFSAKMGRWKYEEKKTYTVL